MKISRILYSIMVVALLLHGGNLLEAMLREGDQSFELVPQKQIITRGKVLTITALAALLAIPVGYVIRVTQQYTKQYGLPATIVALRYSIPFQPLYLKTLATAAQQNDALLKDNLIALNTALLGKDWRHIRSILIDDFITMDQIAFSQKHATMRMQIMNLLKTYAAAWDLYFKKSNIRTYTHGMPSIKNQAKYMQELDQAIGLI